MPHEISLIKVTILFFLLFIVAVVFGLMMYARTKYPALPEIKMTLRFERMWTLIPMVMMIALALPSIIVFFEHVIA